MTTRINVTILACFMLCCVACSSDKKTQKDEVSPDETTVEQASTEAPSSQPANGAPASQPASASDTPALPPASWIAERVASSQARLDATPGGKIIARAIATHGGLEQWYSRGPVKFQFTYTPVDTTKAERDTVQVIDTWSSRARHNMPGDDTIQFGWDGAQAWTTSEELPVKPRFWSLTPFYFVAVPFVFADEGVNLEAMGEIKFEERTYDLVKATFNEGTGDAPDDFYIVYVDRETSRVGGVRYVVSYPGFFPDGGHSPEKFMAYDSEQRIDGVVFAKTFRTFSWDAEKQSPIEVVTNSRMTEVSFDAATPSSFFAVPEGAKVIEGL